jgi:hypothetical protein
MSVAELLALVERLVLQARPLLAEPWASPALAALAGVLLACLCAPLLLRRRGAPAAPEFATLDAQVHALAAEGAAYAEIARRTGLSRDAVGLMLRVAAHRQNSPLAAASAVAVPARAPVRSAVEEAQVSFNQRLAEFAAGRRRPARALPFSGAGRRAPATEAA